MAEHVHGAEAQMNDAEAQVRQGSRCQNLLAKLQPSIEQSPDHPENTRQAEEGTRAAEEVTDGQLIRIWRKFAIVADYVILTLSVISSIISLIWNCVTNELYNPALDGTTLGLVIIDCFLLTVYVKLAKRPANRELETERMTRFQNWRGWFDNLVAEWLLYPATMFSVISISTQRLWIRDYTDPTAISRDDFYAIWDVLFALLDMLILFYIYGERVYMIRSLVIVLKREFGNEVHVGRWCGCDTITRGIIYFTIANAFLFLFMVVQIFIQVYNDNLPENKPLAHLKKEQELGDDAEIVYMQSWTIAMLVLTLFLPMVNLMAFLCSNSYYILRLLININRHGRDILLAAGAIGEEQANDIESLNRFQKLSFSSRVWWMNLVLFFWAMLFAAYTMVFSRYYIENIEISSWSTSTPSQQASIAIYILFYVLSFALLLSANMQSFVAVGVGSFIAIVRFISWLASAVQTPQPPPPRIELLQPEREDQIQRLQSRIQLLETEINQLQPPLNCAPPILMREGRRWVNDEEIFVNGKEQKVISVSSRCDRCDIGCEPLNLTITVRQQNAPPRQRRPGQASPTRLVRRGQARPVRRGQARPVRPDQPNREYLYAPDPNARP